MKYFYCEPNLVIFNEGTNTISIFEPVELVTGQTIKILPVVPASKKVGRPKGVLNSKPKKVTEVKQAKVAEPIMRHKQKPFRINLNRTSIEDLSLPKVDKKYFLDEDTFDEIMQMSSDPNVKPLNIAQDLGIQLSQVLYALRATSFENYLKIANEMAAQ